MTSLIVVSAARSPWGAEASLRTLLPALATEYEEVTVVVPTQNTADFFGKIDGVDVQLAGYKSRVQYIFEVTRLLLQKRKDSHVLVFSLQLVPLALPIRLLRPQMRILADLHDAPRDPVDRNVVRLLLPLFHGIITISSYVRSHFKNDRAIVIPRPIEPVKIAPKNVRGALTIGIAGRLDREKEIELAIEVAAAIPTIRLVVFGEGLTHGDEYLSELQSLAAERAPGRVRFAGRVEPAAIFDTIDVLFVGNRNEPSGRTVGEAMWAGVPVVTPSTGGSSEFYEDGVSGLRYTAGSPESATKAVQRLADPEVRAEFGRAASSHMQATRDPKQLARSYATAIRGHHK